MRWRAWWALLLVGCLPNGPPTGSKEEAASSARKVPVVRPAVSANPEADPMLVDVFEDSFERGIPGTMWRSVGHSWKIQNGRLCSQGARNRGIWLARRLPVNARVEFEASSASPDGDIKAEFWGDGITGATGVLYSNASSYLAIFGGWKNTRHVLARLDEHGEDRQQVLVDFRGEEPRTRAVKPHQIYRIRVERTDGRTVVWFVDEVVLLRFEDKEPLLGKGHDHFGFNNWDTQVCFDNLRVTPLPE